MPLSYICVLPINEGQSTECGTEHAQVGKVEVDRAASGIFERNIREVVGVVSQSLLDY